MMKPPVDKRVTDMIDRKLTAADLVPNTGVSDSIPAVLTDKQGKVKAPARLSEGEYVIKANIVSNLGGGATEPGFQVLDKLTKAIESMDRYQAAEFGQMCLMVASQIQSSNPEFEDIEE